MNRTTKALLVLLRIAIGWHFLYEGVFKIDSGGGQPYLTSRYHLQTATARLRDACAAAPDPAAAFARIDEWHDGIVAWFKSQDNPLSDEQKSALATVRDRLKDAVAAAPDNIGNLDWQYVHAEVLKVADQPPPPEFSAESYLLASQGPFRFFFRGLVTDAAALDRLTRESAEARIDRRYDEIVAHFASRGRPLTTAQRAALARVRDDLKRATAATLADPAFQARLADYRRTLQRVRETGTGAPFTKERLLADRKKLDTIAAELVAFVNEPIAELGARTQALETVEQMRAGPPPRPRSQTWLIDWFVKWGLTAIGLCLMLGLLTPIAAVAAALQLGFFYLAMPPWPGLPSAETTGHYLFVDRNLIELVAALVLAAVPAGQWAGLDALIQRLKGAAPCFSTKNNAASEPTTSTKPSASPAAN